MFKRFLISLALLAFWPALAFAQSDPGLYNGQIPTAAQWNSFFAAKTDYPITCATGSLYGNTSGITGPLTCVPTSAFTNVGSAFRWVNARTISITGDLSYTSSAMDGTGNVTGTGTLATVNANVGSFTCSNFTVNAKGLITAAANGSCSGGSGTVTNVATGTCLTGGPITTTGTLALNLGCAPTWSSLVTFSSGAVITPEATPATNEAGYLGAPENTQNTSYSLVMTDAGKLIYHTSATPHTYTIPANASVAYPIGTTIVIANEDGAGAITLSITSDTLRWTNLTGSRTIAADGTVTITKVAATVWRLTGDGVS